MSHGHNSLFQTPEDVRYQETQRRIAEGRQYSDNPFAGALTNLAHNLLGKGTKYFSPDSEIRSQQEVTAENIQKMIKGLDFTNRKSVAGVANKLQQAGHMEEARQIMTMMPAVGATTYGDVYTKEIQVTGADGVVKTVNQQFQMGSNGKVTSVGSGVTSDRATSAGKPDKINMTPWRGVKVDEAMSKLSTKTVTNELKGMLTDEDNTAGVVGKVQVLASQMQKDLFEKTLAASRDGTHANPNRWFNEQYVPGPELFVDKALQLLLSSGGIEDFIDRGVTGDDVDTNTRKFNTPQELAAQQADFQAASAAAAESDALSANRVVGLSQDTNLQLKDITNEQGVAAFANFENDSDEQIAARFGMDMSKGDPEVWETHKDSWQSMRNQKKFTRAWLSATTRRERRNITFEVLDKLNNERRYQDLNEVSRVTTYLERMQKIPNAPRVDVGQFGGA